MRSLLGLGISLALLACAEQPSEQTNTVEQTTPSRVTGTDDLFAARLASGDPTLCKDEALHRRVVLESLTGSDPQATEKYQLLLTNGGHLEFEEARMTGARKEIGEVTCSAILPKGFSDKPYPFTYALRPDRGGSGVVLGAEGKIDRWFHFRWAVISKLAEMGLADAPPSAGPPGVPIALPQQETKLPAEADAPYEPPAEDALQVPAGPAGHIAGPEPIATDEKETGR